MHVLTPGAPELDNCYVVKHGKLIPLLRFYYNSLESQQVICNCLSHVRVAYTQAGKTEVPRTVIPWLVVDNKSGYIATKLAGLSRHGYLLLSTYNYTHTQD